MCCLNGASAKTIALFYFSEHSVKLESMHQSTIIRSMKIGKTASMNDEILTMAAEANLSTPGPVVLTAADIPGAELSMPYEAHPVPALK